MRLLEVKTLEPVEFVPSEIPPYAILSHTWEADEVNFQELTGVDKSWQSKAGWSKIKACARQADSDGYSHIWVDTCCIDKKSSAELQEAINSMFRWYEASEVCYVYLADCTFDETRGSAVLTKNLRWFSRGWTLQELIAPRKVLFFDKDWKRIGWKHGLLREIFHLTGVRTEFLCHLFPPSWASVAERMSWAANRQTTREEDMAYCMLGIFGIHMPMLYGEGRGAFRRLQEEIIKVNDDATILAWGATNYALGRGKLWGQCIDSPLFAEQPRDFLGGDLLCPLDTNDEEYRFNRFFMTQRGLQISLDVAKDPNFQNLAYGVLNCADYITSDQRRELDLAPNPRLRLRYTRFLAYPPCELGHQGYWSTRNADSASIMSSFKGDQQI
ncbi:heterokaryon incompatibility protein-domain-containing protein [Microdochium trichocladiopsis]|uniref:Heterokaryon incompatibility protein-domain-containing protein n=1 Tax=Microdochium trichocladiopsis TaxID=1682393 RepID=A0A9P8XX35_9PEZI|nr:heterokaryon incompatibility protein-domain-containing protein [Microdochium trichocladiopsis]KAH7018087.1 heterokaryon incompatibility protein-domain-containing protein [Microdochium trichocladiopsis]